MIKAPLRLYYYGSIKALLRRYSTGVRSRGGGWRNGVGDAIKAAILLRRYYIGSIVKALLRL